MSEEEIKRILLTTGYTKEVDKHAIYFYIQKLQQKNQNLIKYIEEELYNLDYGWTKGIVKHKTNKDLLIEILGFIKENK